MTSFVSFSHWEHRWSSYSLTLSTNMFFMLPFLSSSFMCIFTSDWEALNCIRSLQKSSVSIPISLRFSCKDRF